MNRNLAFIKSIKSICTKPKFYSTHFRKVPIKLDYGKKKYTFSKISIGLVAGLLICDGIGNNFTYTLAGHRFFRSLMVATLISKDYLITMWTNDESDENYQEKLKHCHQKSANRILDACLKNGGLYIKVGQGVAAINHMLPAEYTKTLSELQDKCLPYDKNDIQKVFLNEFGKKPEEIFDEFDYKPIAAASLAQVFYGKIDGNEIAVKVQYSDLQKRFTSDIGTIIFLQDIIEFFFQNYNFGWILKDIKKNLRDEMDFINEGKNAEKCYEDLKKFNFVYVPKIYWNYTNKRVLTMEWINGYKVTDITQIKKNNINLKELDTKLFKIFSEQIFGSGWVHADPHPGNIFIRKRNNKMEIVLLDHGLYQKLPDQNRRNLAEFWEATVLKDENKMKKNALELNVNSFKAFAEVLFQVPYEINDGKIKTRLTDSDINYMQELARKHFDIIMNTLKEMPRNMLFIVRNLNTIRAISREHGDLVDRPKVMARYAQKCMYTSNNTFIGYFKWLWRRIFFEYCLIKQQMHSSFISIYVDVLYKLGRSPKDSKYLKTLGDNSYT